ncbi:hypothetical protein Fuma_05553 [Fuerstiella marisgermanici]|uniref:Uncharacterized protein n=1 Tax=Fuerstiella marisgermanici TaxID=1891926 RepID=A0A1P8WPA8_9PLAN|nr:hypothetical protein Fuma_05553 [Fuerstiella marisgermanici]
MDLTGLEPVTSTMSTKGPSHSNFAKRVFSLPHRASHRKTVASMHSFPTEKGYDKGYSILEIEKFKPIATSNRQSQRHF